MNRTTLFVFAGVTLLILVALGVYLRCTLSDDCSTCDRVSLSKEESMANDLFVTSYRPVTTEVALKFHDDRVQLKEMWVEKRWTMTGGACLWKTIQPKQGYNANVEFSKQQEGFSFDLRGHGSPYGMGATSKIVMLRELPDTLKFVLVERNPKAPEAWKREVPGDVLLFVRNK
jgi:hypothetical protein